jgi:hypothetical protein
MSRVGLESVGWVSPVNVPVALPNSFHLPIKLHETTIEDREAANVLIGMTTQQPGQSFSSFDPPLNQKRGKCDLSLCTALETPAKKSRLTSSPFSEGTFIKEFNDIRSGDLSSPSHSYTSSNSIDEFDPHPTSHPSSSTPLSFVTPLKRFSPRDSFHSPCGGSGGGGRGVTLDILADMAAGQLTSKIISSELNSMQDTFPANTKELTNIEDIGDIVIHTLTNLRSSNSPQLRE